MSSPSPDDAARSRDRRIGLAVIVVTFAATMALSIWAKHRSRPEVSEPPGPPVSEGIAGFPSQVDPVASLGLARTLTKRKVLRGIALEGVRSDGTIDLAEGPGRARYSFQSLPGEGPQPARELGERAVRSFCGKQNVHLRKEGLVADPDLPDHPCAPTQAEDLPEPRCTAKQVWARAVVKGAPRDRLARIDYYRSAFGPTWRFELPGTPHRYALYGDCERELDVAATTGFVP